MAFKFLHPRQKATVTKCILGMKADLERMTDKTKRERRIPHGRVIERDNTVWGKTQKFEEKVQVQVEGCFVWVIMSFNIKRFKNP